MVLVYLSSINCCDVKKKEHLKFYEDPVEALQFYVKISCCQEKVYHQCILFAWKWNNGIIQMHFEALMPQLFPK